MANETTLCLYGEVDMVSRPTVERALTVLIAADVDVVVDCAAVTFIDSMGVAALVEARTRLDAGGHVLRMRNLAGPPRRAFEVLGLEGVLGVEP